MNYLCWYPSVQEQPIKFNNVATPASALFAVGSSLLPVNISLVFTEISLQGSQQSFFDDCTVANVPTVTIQNCQLGNMSLVVNGVQKNVSDPGALFILKNNAFTRSTIQLFGGNYVGDYYNPLSLSFYNNLFWDSDVKLVESTNDMVWILNDNLFVSSTNSFGSLGALALTAANNAYYKTTTNVFPDTNFLILTNLAFDVGPFGGWYADSNALSLNPRSLTNNGSRTAAAAGLTNFTLFTNLNSSGAEVADTGTVDIGFHHFVTDSNGYPVGCQALTNFQVCLISPSLSITPPYIFSSTNGRATNTGTATVTLSPGLASADIILCNGDYEFTNIVLPTNDLTILSNWNIVTWNGVSHTNLGTLSWTLAMTNGGIGTNTFYVKYSDATPCGGTFTNSLMSTFAVATWMTPLPCVYDAFGPGIDSSPALSHDGSTVYIASTSNFMYAINVTNGTWSLTNGASTWRSFLPLEDGEITPSPTVAADGSVLIGSTTTNGFFYDFNANGSTSWSNDIGNGNAVFSTAAVLPSGMILIGLDEATQADTGETGFYSFRTNRATNWIFTPQNPLYGTDSNDVDCSPAIAADGTIYFDTEGDRQYALDQNGNVKWFLPIASRTEPDSSPAIGSDGTIYVGSTSPYFYAINPDGSIKWIFHTTEELQGTGRSTVIYSSPAVDANSIVYFGTGVSWVYANPGYHDTPTNFQGIFYAISNGVQLWAYTNTQGEIASSPALASDGTVFVGARIDINPNPNNLGNTTNGLLLAICNGALRWSIQLPAEVVSSPVITSNGTVIFGCEDGNVYAIPTPSLPATNAPWPMFHRDAQHTGCVAIAPPTPPSPAPLPNDGKLTLPPYTPAFTFSLIGPASSSWTVFASTNLLNLTNRLGTVRLGANGYASFRDTSSDIANDASKFYFLSNSLAVSRVIGFIELGLTPGTNLITDPLIQVDDTNFVTLSPPTPMNSVESVFLSGFPYLATISSWNGNSFITETNGINNGDWIPTGDIMLLPGVAVVVSNSSSSISTQSLIGLVRPSVTNQMPAGTSYLGSALPVAGLLTSKLGFTNLSWGDTNITWNSASNRFVTNVWTNGVWYPNEPFIALGQGFIMKSTNSHVWVQSFSPEN